jgi:hypothetical protein
MITFSFIGNYGRLGNQMFQYAAIVGIAKKNGYDYCFPLQNTQLPKWFKITAKNGMHQCQRAHLEKFGFEPAVFQLPDNIDYSGYFQSEKYFQHCPDFIKNEFTFKDEIREKIDQWFGDKEYISVHVRRGDYLTIQNIHPVQPIEWYQKAMEAFPNKKFLFFSDDLEWCRHTFPANEFSCFSNEGEDMYAMSKCNGHIITNSSFSWWAAWLSGKQTIAPKTWFGPEGPQDWQDIYCKDWRIL